MRGLYLHYCYKLGILPKGKKQNHARLHYLLKDDLMKMEAITDETRLLCRCHIDTAEQLLSYKGSLESEMSELTEQRKGLYSQSRKSVEEEKEQQRKELKVFTVKSGDLKKLTQEAKKYGVLYCVLADRGNKDPNAEVDVIARAEDASKISRVVERFNLASVDAASIATEAEKSKGAR
nr:PcfB family protein [uncultured Bacteroides sp.]